MASAMRHSHSRRSDSGFSLLEVLVAATLLIVAVAGVAYVFSAAAAASQSAKRSTRCVMLAMDRIEHLRALPFDDGELAVSAGDALAADIEGFHDVLAGGYHRRWSVTPVATHPTDALTLRVVVWQPGFPGDASLVTIKARKVE